MSNRSITLVAPARFVEDAILAQAVNLCVAHGLDPTISSSCGLRHHQFAGTDEERADAFVHEWNEGASEFLWCIAGAIGTGRIMRHVRGRLRPGNKTLIGYSDCNYLQAHIVKNRLGRAVHGPMPVDWRREEAHGSVELLLAKVAADNFSVQWQSPADVIVRPGTAHGPAIVGNMAILSQLIGVPEEPDWTGAILFLEDINEWIFRLDRMFLHFTEAGVLDRISGLVLGSFTGLEDNPIPFGYTVEEMALHYLGHRTIPIIRGFPTGHGAENVPIVIGAECQITGDASSCMIDIHDRVLELNA